MRMIFAAVSPFVLVIAAASCGAPAAVSRGPDVAGATAMTASLPKAPGEATLGDLTTCPVSGEQFVVSATSPHTEVEGKTYYFCCAECAHKFEAQPSKYLAKPGAVGQRAEAADLPLKTR